MDKSLSRRQFLMMSGTFAMTGLLHTNFPKTFAQDDESMNWQSTGQDVPELSVFDDTFQTYMSERAIPNGSVAVTRNGKLVLARGYTFGDRADMQTQPTSLFRLASLSKPITGAAIAYLIMQGNLNLADKLVDLIDLQPISGNINDDRINDITVAHLLHHVAGWDREQSFDPMFRDEEIATAYGISFPIEIQHIIDYMADRSLDNPPGEQYAYSNFGYSLLGRIIEAVTGEQYEAYVKTHVLNPIGAVDMRLGRSLRANRFDHEVAYYMEEGPQPVASVVENNTMAESWSYGGWNLENMDAHGGWLASAVDLARFAVAYDDPNNSPIINEQTMPIITDAPEGIPITGGHYYGGGWLIRSVRDISFNMWHAGSLDGTYTLIVRRWDGLNWVALFNQRDDSGRGGYGSIDGLMHDAANSIIDWPEHDLFDND